MHHTTTILIQPDGVTVPTGIPGLRVFRRWVHSPRFPEKGRIDWLAGQVEVDMSPEDLTTHGTPKVAIARDLSNRIEGSDRGAVFSDSTRLTAKNADLSSEPDVVVVLFESLRAGRVRLVPRAGRPAGRYAEIEGAADLVVECVSDSSTLKDTEKLPRLYHRAGVREYWLVDARGARVAFTLFRRAARKYAVVRPDAGGFRKSAVLGVAVRLVRLPAREGVVRYRLEFKS